MNLSGLFKINRKRATFVLLLYFVYAITGTIDFYLFQFAVNALGAGNLSEYIKWQVFEFIPAFLGITILPLATYLFNQQIQDYIDKLRSKMVSHFYAENDLNVAQMQNNLQNNLDILTIDYALPWIDIVSNFLIILLSVGALFNLNWTFVLLTGILVLINLYLPKVMQKKTSQASTQVAQNNGSFLTVIGDWISGLNELRRYHAVSILNRELAKYGEQLEKSKVHQTKTRTFSNTVNGFGNTIGQLSIAFLAGILFLLGQIKIGTVLAATSFAYSIFSAVSAITVAMVKLKSTKTINENTQKMIAGVEKDKSSSAELISQIEVKNLVLKYDHSPEIAYPNFTINKGEKILLTGDSGTGKSTLLKAILGEIIYKNDVGDQITRDLKQIGYLAQDPKLFPCTIADNIVMLHHELYAKIPQLLNKVQLETDVMRFPAGVETVVDLDQDNLSGGQRQKVILAREEVFYNNFVLMDEATGAIDSKVPKKIIEYLVSTDKNIVLIAHNFDERITGLFDREIQLTGRSSLTLSCFYFYSQNFIAKSYPFMFEY